MKRNAGILIAVLLVSCLILADSPGRKALLAARSVSGGEPPRVALTFDDGPHPVYTKDLLDGLQKRGVCASFFLIGQNIEDNEELVERMEEEGHLVGNHTFHHVRLSTVSEETAEKEILDTCSTIQNITGIYPSFVRPPFGEWKEGLDLHVSMMPVTWSLDSRDWTTKNKDKIVKRVVKDVKEGDIILMHDIYGSSVEAALEIVDILKAQGYEFVTADKLLLE